MIDQQIEIPTKDGHTTTFITHPKRGGPHPVIIFYIDAPAAEVEVYPGTHHGFAFPKRPVYHRDAAERHWERLLALYRRNLSS